MWTIIFGIAWAGTTLLLIDMMVYARKLRRALKQIQEECEGYMRGIDIGADRGNGIDIKPVQRKREQESGEWEDDPICVKGRDDEQE